MTTTDAPTATTMTREELRQIPGYEEAADRYVTILFSCKTEMDHAFRFAYVTGGVPNVSEVMEKYEDRLREQHAIVKALVKPYVE